MPQLIVLATISVSLIGDNSSAAPAIVGTVQSSAGQPLPDATVFIRTAAPREGVGVL